MHTCCAGRGCGDCSYCYGDCEICCNLSYSALCAEYDNLNSVQDCLNGLEIHFNTVSHLRKYYHKELTSY